MDQQKLIRHGIVTLVTLLLTLPFLGSAHLFDWDEINFAEAAREMIVSGNWSQVQINFTPFWEKPPLFFWLQALSMKIFGINEFAARFPNALGAVIWANLFFYIGSKHFGPRMGVWWLLFYFGSFTPFFYFKSGIIDPWFNLFIFSSIYLIFNALKFVSRKNLLLFLAGICLGLAVITKGPVALIVVGLTALFYWFFNGMRKLVSVLNVTTLLLGIVLIPALWFLPETIKNGPWFLLTFLSYQADLLLNPVASHGQPWFYHPLVLLVGCFPAGIFAMSKFRQERGMTSDQIDLKRWLVIMFWVVLVLFSIVTTKIVHYSSLCYIPLTFLAALNLYDFEKNAIRYQWKIQPILLIFISFLWSVLLLAVGLLAANEDLKAKILPWIKDEFAKANLLVNGGWNGYEFVLGIIFMLGWLLFFILKNKEKWALISIRGILIFQIGMLFLITAIYVPRIERHTQGAAVEFYQRHAQKDAVILTYKFKSYAHYFYGQVKNVNWTSSELAMKKDLLSQFNAKSLRDLTLREIESFEEKWKYLLMHDASSSRKIFVVCLEKKAFEVDENSLFRRLYSKGGFVFYEKIN